jgi:hypothetical protein
VGGNGVSEVGAGANWSHGFFTPRDVSSKGCEERDLPAKFGLGGVTTLGGAGEVSLGALLVNAMGARGATGTGASVFSREGAEDLVGDEMGGTFGAGGKNGAKDRVDDGLFADGVAGCAFCASRDIANGEM